MLWMKSLHIAAIAIWASGLVCLPALYVQRAHVPDKASLHRLQAMVRFLFVAVISPAAFLAVATGTALVFMRGVYAPWFSLKLVFVGAMVTIHLLTGLVIIRLFEEGNIYPVWRFAAVTAATLLVAGAVLALVLAKPDIPDLLPAAMSEPGALSRIADAINPFRR